MRLLCVKRPIGTVGPAGMGQATAAVALAPGSVGANVVAIDNKIEQAMDLVKTHLLYAVREEVEVLKEKIIDLEKKVFRLETENKLLREYAPPEILQQIQHQHQPQSSGSVGTGSLVNSHTNSISSISTSSIPQTTNSTSSSSSLLIHQTTPHSSVTQAAPVLTAQQSVQGTAMANINTPVTTAASSAALSQHPQQ